MLPYDRAEDRGRDACGMGIPIPIYCFYCQVKVASGVLARSHVLVDNCVGNYCDIVYFIAQQNCLNI